MNNINWPQEPRDHPLTGRPFIGTSVYTFGPALNSLQSRWCWVWNVTHVDKKGRIYYTPRWTQKPFRWLYKIHRRMQPQLCRVGRHDPMDICNADGSVTDAECAGCHTLVSPRRPHPPDEKRVADYAKWDEWGEEYEAAREAYEAGEGPCPDCKYEDGKHSDKCWMAD